MRGKCRVCKGLAMPSLDEFRRLLEGNADDAFKQYSLLIDCDRLDFAVGGVGHDEFKICKVSFVYQQMDGKDVILMTPDANGKDISYLPWKNASEGGIAKATLNANGPKYFSTSQLDGCRFSIHYHDAEHKTVTVQHLAGDAGGAGSDGSRVRDDLERNGLQGKQPVVLQRRYSIGLGQGKLGRIGAQFKSGRAETTYYDGGKAAVFGYRNKAGAWVFYGAETDVRKGAGAGLKNLVTQSAVAGSLRADSSG
jgi:hypothetical protein